METGAAGGLPWALGDLDSEFPGQERKQTWHLYCLACDLSPLGLVQPTSQEDNRRPPGVSRQQRWAAPIRGLRQQRHEYSTPTYYGSTPLQTTAAPIHTRGECHVPQENMIILIRIQVKMTTVKLSKHVLLS